VVKSWYTQPVGSRQDVESNRFWGSGFMQKTRRARAIAIALVKDDARQKRLRLLVISIGAMAALLSLPAFFH
jgi:hypothetical protein